MRLDKFTTKFQEALGDAQSLALGNDNAYIEPVHVLLAMLRQDDGPRALLQRAGANVPGLLAGAEGAARRLPHVTGQDQVQGGPELGRVLQPQDQIVLVAVTSAHRGESFQACEFLMDYLKTQAPFWKKEATAGGARWVDARVSDDAALARWGIEARNG